MTSHKPLGAMFETMEDRRLMSATVGDVTGFTLIDAKTDRVIGTISNGSTIDLATIAGRSINLAAVVGNGPVESVKLALDGTKTVKTENDAPYALAGDKNGNFNGFTPTLGTHTIMATPYAQDRARGAVGAAMKVTFTVIDGSKPTTNPTPTPTPNPNPTPNPTPNPSTGAYQEVNGVVVIEAESQPTPSAWTRSTQLGGFTGDGYIQANRDASGGGTGTITYTFVIHTPGNYELALRNRIAVGDESTEANDSFVQFPTGQDIPGQWSLGGAWTKTYLNDRYMWSWRTSTKDRDPQRLRQYFSAGEHTIKLSVRSAGHAIDRIVLFNYDTVTFAQATSTTLPESPKA